MDQIEGRETRKSKGRNGQCPRPCGYDSPRKGWNDPEYQIENYLKPLWRIKTCFCRVSQVGHGKRCMGWVTLERMCCFHQQLLRFLIRQCRFMLHDQPIQLFDDSICWLHSKGNQVGIQFGVLTHSKVLFSDFACNSGGPKPKTNDAARHLAAVAAVDPRSTSFTRARPRVPSSSYGKSKADRLDLFSARFGVCSVFQQATKRSKGCKPKNYKVNRCK